MLRLDLSWIRERLSRHEAVTISPHAAPTRAAVAIIFHQAESTDLELLLIRRAVHSDDPWSGHMAFPGGRVEATDLSPQHAARRETLEEVHIDLEASAEELGLLDDIRASARGRVLPLAITPVVFFLPGPVTPRRCSDEVEEILWVPVRVLFDLSFRSTVPYELGGQRYDLPCFKIDGRIIWGLTYQMLMRLFAVLDWPT
jgi:8-oxo-dGTP pyrophosphatase MutT (NUDIX family)